MQENLSARLKALRTSRKLSQKTLGQNVNLSMQAINEIEHGRRATTIDKLIALSDFFAVSIDYLVGHSDEAMPLALPNDAKMLLSSYLTLSISDRKRLMDYMELLQSSQRD